MHYLSQCWPRFMLLYDVTRRQWVKSLSPQQNGWYIADDILKCFFSYWKVQILIQITLKFFTKGPIDIKSALVQVMLRTEQATSHWPNQCWNDPHLWQHIASLGHNHLTLNVPVQYIYGTRIWSSLCLLMVTDITELTSAWWDLNSLRSDNTYIICASELTIIVSDNGLSPGRRQAIIWTNAGILLMGPWGTNFCEILIGIPTFSFKKMHLKMSSAKWRPVCFGLNELSIFEENCHVIMHPSHTNP